MPLNWLLMGLLALSPAGYTASAGGVLAAQPSREALETSRRQLSPSLTLGSHQPTAAAFPSLPPHAYAALPFSGLPPFQPLNIPLLRTHLG